MAGQIRHSIGAAWQQARAKAQSLRTWFRALPKAKRRVGYAAMSVSGLWLLFLLLDALFPLPSIKPYSQTVYAADGSLICASLTPDDKWRLRTDLDHVAADMKNAILQKEDRWFYWHYGVNPLALLRAFGGNVWTGKRLSGASTITMQLARMNERAPRTYARKFREMFRAVQYEWHYSKKEILEMYLSQLPYGGNVEGVHSAAYIFFGRSPQQLSLAQSVLLAVVPNRPNSLRIDAHPDAARAMRDKWLTRLRSESDFAATAADWDAALNEPLPTFRHPIPFQNPQFCHFVSGLERSLSPDNTRSPEVYTTLSPRIQHTVSDLVANHVRRSLQLGVTNGAVLVVENATGKVLAYCGSADFNDKENGGEIDGIHAIRSPGSALKPAAYALGFDMGLITPQTRLLDVPTTFRGFTPENYHPEYAGDVTVHYALTHSLNVPVVRLVNDFVGLDKYLNTLVQGRFEMVRKQQKSLGLSAVTGGCGVTVEEMTRFYTAFANGGEMRELRYLRPAPDAKNSLSAWFGGKKDTVAPNVRLFSEGTAWLIASILSDIERPDLPQRYIDESKLPKVAWKTGTSYGRRDAWAMGFSPRYTVGVWMGNFDNRGVPDLSGSSMAVPLLLDIFNAIDYDATDKWFPRPQSVGKRKVCSETGMLPAPTCQHFAYDDYLVNISPMSVCDLYQNVYVNESETMQYCTGCLPQSGYHERAYPHYAPELVAWFGQNRISYLKPPPHNSACRARFSTEGPTILSPKPDFEYFVEIDNEQEIALQAASPPEIGKHYWYVNGKFLKAASPDEKIFYRPRVGTLEISCVDDKGRKSSVKIQVKGY